MTLILSALFSPLGRAVGIGALILALVGGIYLKGRHDDHAAYTQQLQKEAVHAVQDADAARNAAEKKFDNGGYRHQPRHVPKRLYDGQSDGFARD